MTVKRLLFYLALGCLAAYCAITYYPGFLFSDVRSCKNITLYSMAPLNDTTERLLARVSDAVAGTDFFNAGQTFEIYLTGGYGGYSFFAPFCGRDYACVHPFSKKVFIAYSDIDKDQAYGYGERQPVRVLENVMIHQLVLAQIRNKMGAVKYFSTDVWKKEGFAEHFARETVGMNTGDICGNWDRSDVLKLLLDRRLTIEQLKAETEIGYARLIDDNVSYESARDRVTRKYCGK